MRSGETLTSPALVPTLRVGTEGRRSASRTLTSPALLSLGGRGGRRKEAGYTLVMLVVATTILSILLAAALPMWSTAIRREKEEELIFRGLQYAEAIRIYQNRYQRFPSRLEELIEVKPRSIRQLYKDPMTEDGKWNLIFDGQPPVDPTKQDEDAEEGQGEIVAVGPIIGVRSRSKETGIRTFLGQERYNEWQFTVHLVVEGLAMGGRGQTGTGQLRGGVGPGGAAGNPTALPDLSSRWIGRPLPSVISGPQGGFPNPTVPGGNPTQKPPRPPRPSNPPD